MFASDEKGEPLSYCIIASRSAKALSVAPFPKVSRSAPEHDSALRELSEHLELDERHTGRGQLAATRPEMA
jgi:hypothetical protein